MDKNSNFKILIISTIISLTIGIVVYFMCNHNQDKIVVVDAVKLFNGFKMKIELEERDELKLKSLGKVVDSLENILKVMQQSNTQKQLDEKMIYEYQRAKSNLQSAYEMSNHDINEQVWKRLNVMIADFGKENKLQIIVGANGMGAVLYNDHKVDLTDNAIQYVNMKYDGK
jgi:outer membrane protein